MSAFLGDELEIRSKIIHLGRTHAVTEAEVFVKEKVDKQLGPSSSITIQIIAKSLGTFHVVDATKSKNFSKLPRNPLESKL